ncbi:DUF4307 domain-containing protein [Nocardioides coralli]|uniref:DUF4307 domain-containing protein n=1 Tax=Nocardioides coralli TaxID=2872154 RepID=UPI001CA39B75|nr:DUF4307 domain-containing protein [Nocardioides coralli]QZY28539.1 DUF4307 domain-containing protein [Nocardioides coralli]
MTSLAERYGSPSRGRRRLGLVLVAAVVAVAAGWLAWATWFHATPAVQSDQLGYEVVDDNTAVAVVQVRLEDGVTASCRVRAFAEDHVTVGELAFEPEPGRNEVRVRTERRATNVTLLGCTAPGQPRPR